MKSREELTARMDQVGKDVRELSRNVWLAGLGAVGSVDEQGRAIFHQLVERGEKLGNELSEKLGDRVGFDVRKPLQDAGDRFKAFSDKLEDRFEHRMTRTLHRFGVPARDDVQQLIERVEQLTLKVEKLHQN
jgi:poly(hydroxyalkanoate) granule-associated protein